MKIIGLEEHVVVPELLAAWSNIPGFEQTPEKGFGNARIAQRLRNVTDDRISDMNDQGIDVQVLSLNTPCVHNLAPADSVVVAREANDALAEIVARNTYETNKHSRRTNLESVHVCEKCDHRLNLADIDLIAITSGTVECPKCQWSGPITIQIIDDRETDS